MVKKGEYTISDIYQGGYSSLSPNYGYEDVFTGYRTNVGSFGLTTDPRTANVLADASAKLATGVKQIELEGISPDVFESIPKQHLREVNRKAKLAGVEVSLHGPIVEASGISREGNFSESNREFVEKQMNLAVERGHELNPKGNVPITFHSSAIIPQQITPEGKEPEETFVINSERGSIHRIPLTKSEFPGEKKGKIDVKEEINKINETQWDESLRNLNYYANIAERGIKESQNLSKAAEAEEAAGKEISPAEKEARISFKRAASFLDDSYRQLQNLYDTAKKHCETEHEKNVLRKFYDNVKQKAEQIKTTEDIYEKANLKREIIDEGSDVLNRITPRIFQPLDEFAKKRSTETFANVAFNSYKKFGSNAPIISIENPPAGGAFSTGKELKDIVEKSRDNFVEKAKQSGMSESEARQTAEKLIGVTWDVGHINMLRKYGYKTEDIIKETEAIKPLLKHVHLSDNFGLEHTELPMGMGNVPIKKIMEKLGKQGEDAKKIIEAGNWWQHFKTPPVKETLQAFGSPIYSMYMTPYWNQTLGLQQGYYAGLAGQWLPQVNYETFGAGFSQLPTELGGQRAGGTQGGRMGGRPME